MRLKYPGFDSEDDLALGRPEPVEPDTIGRKAKAFLVLAFYLLYVVLSIAIEAEARRRFHEPEQPRLANASSRGAELHAELARMNARRAMESWPPYQVYSGAAFVLGLAASLAGFVFGLVLVIRGRRRGIPFAGGPFGALFVLLLAAAGFFAGTLPMLLAKWLWNT